MASRLGSRCPTSRPSARPRFTITLRPACHSGSRVACNCRLIAGSGYGRTAPVEVFSPMFDLACEADAGAELELPPEHAERAVYVLEGSAELAGRRIDAGQLAIELGGAPGSLRALTSLKAMLFGGAPFGVPPHVWWNFVAVSRERIEQAKADWSAGRFGRVPGETEFIALPAR